MSGADALDLSSLQQVGRLWRLQVVALCPGRVLAGSPERSLARAVVADGDGRLFLMERLSQAMAPRKRQIAALLEALAGAGLAQVNPYLPDARGQHVLPLGSDYWQISPYLESAPLPRPGWVWEAWRGDALAAFLVDLHAASARVRLFPEPPFAVTQFAVELLARLETHRPALAGALRPTVERLREDWLAHEDTLATTLCHGDPHPVNVLWSASPSGDGAPGDSIRAADGSRAADGIRAVIDWEFCGVKPAAYDAALIIGCVGIEEPAALMGPFVRALLAGLRAAGHPAVEPPAGSDTALWALVLGIRLAWLSDHLRRGDEEMVALEQDYLRLLVDQRASLERVWSEAEMPASGAVSP